MRKYKTGTNWCIWRWSDTDSKYLTRLHIIKSIFGALCIHWLFKPDPEPFHHDHPVSFISFIPFGGYTENRNGILKERKWFNYIKASPDDIHTIVDVKPGTMTICLMGPKQREWGFHTDKGWIWWKDYYTEQRILKNA